MKLPKLKTVLLAPLALFALFYIAGAIVFSMREAPSMQRAESPVAPLHIAIFGASGTAGDGILKTALTSTDIASIQVITRRLTPRIEAGVAAGKIQLTLHNDYQNYTAIQSQIAEVDTVFWAIGISSLGADEKNYGMIHTDFPMKFVEAWTAASKKSDISFHFISSSDISENSSTMWVREKIRAEKTLFKFSEASKLRVIAYRPDYIGPTIGQANLGQSLLYWFFKPVGAAVRATQIGQAMITVARIGPNIENGSKLSTREIIDYSNTFDRNALRIGQ